MKTRKEKIQVLQDVINGKSISKIVDPWKKLARLSVDELNLIRRILDRTKGKNPTRAEDACLRHYEKEMVNRPISKREEREIKGDYSIPNEVIEGDKARVEYWTWEIENSLEREYS